MKWSRLQLHCLFLCAARLEILSLFHCMCSCRLELLFCWLQWAKDAEPLESCFLEGREEKHLFARYIKRLENHMASCATCLHVSSLLALPATQYIRPCCRSSFSHKLWLPLSSLCMLVISLLPGETVRLRVFFHRVRIQWEKTSHVIKI